MREIDIREAETRLELLVDEAAAGQPFVITKAGKPIAKVVAVDAIPAKARLGGLEGYIKVPQDFVRIGRDEIARLFGLPRPL